MNPVVCLLFFVLYIRLITLSVHSGTFDISLTSRLTTHALESLVAEMYLGEGATSIKCTTTRGAGSGGFGNSASMQSGPAGMAGTSWVFDAKKMVRIFFLCIAPKLAPRCEANANAVD